MTKRIYPAARRQQGAAPIQIVQPVMAGVKISDAHKAGVVETQDFRINRNTMRRHRNNIRRIIEWLDENYSNYRGAGGIHKLTEEQLNDPTV